MVILILWIRFMATSRTVKVKSLEFWELKSSKGKIEQVSLSGEMIHQLTHQKIRCRILHIKSSVLFNVEGYEWKTLDAIGQLAFPRLITRYKDTIHA